MGRCSKNAPFGQKNLVVWLRYHAQWHPQHVLGVPGPDHWGATTQCYGDSPFPACPPAHSIQVMKVEEMAASSVAHWQSTDSMTPRSSSHCLPWSFPSTSQASPPRSPTSSRCWASCALVGPSRLLGKTGVGVGGGRKACHLQQQGWAMMVLS